MDALPGSLFRQRPARQSQTQLQTARPTPQTEFAVSVTPVSSDPTTEKLAQHHLESPTASVTTGLTVNPAELATSPM